MLSKFNDAFKIEETTDFLYDIVDCFSFEISAIAKVSERIIKSPWFLGQQIFWNNFKKFLCGIKSDPEFEAKFATKITNSPKRNNYAIKIIKTIDDIDDEEKIDWIINATRSLCWDNISIDEYFRICTVIRNCYFADLIFLKNNFSTTKYFPYNLTVSQLEINGLMVQTIIDGGSFNNSNSEPVKTHQFNDLAELVYKNSLSYE